MSNTINSNLQSLLNKTEQKVNGSEKGQSSGTSATVSAASASKTSVSDTVNLTEQSLLLAGLEKKVAEMPAIDQSRVDAVKADIASGNYHIDLDNLAELLMQSDLDSGE